MTNTMVRDRLAQIDTVNGFLFTGCRRTLPQVVEFDALLTDVGKQLDVVVEITADAGEVTALLPANSGSRIWDTDPMQRRALVVDDEKLVAALVRDMLATAGFEVQLAHTAGVASNYFHTFDPDVAILDISLGPGPSGLDLAYMASEAYPGVALLLLTRYPDLRTAQVRPEDLPTNCGFLSKDSVVDAGVLLAAVEAVLQDGQPRGSEPGGRANPLASLTPVQLRVLRLVAQGYTSTEIARRRDCSVSAVEKVLRGIYQRLGITTDGVIHPRVEAIRIYAATAVIPERPDGQ